MVKVLELDPRHRIKLEAVYIKLVEVYGNPTWRNPLPPIDELVSTILSQNTNDTNRDQAFFALKSAYPRWEDVRDANLDLIIEKIRIAGLANQKGAHIKGALREISAAQGYLSLEFLKDLSIEEARVWLTNLKGVGPKTAAIVLLFSMGIPAFPVDTHIYRVSGRIGFRPLNINVEKTHAYLEAIGQPEWFYSLHLNLIRLGRETCHARKWNCDCCPVIKLCAFEDKIQTG
ncbi:MAG: hypothetical protein MUO40_14730 [Anaerolineaceae bacterium]|nr:hypothetical protein [Anaerolineaceae bacterium]